MTNPPFTMILCEGYHDRAFLTGLLLQHLGWTDPGQRPNGKRTPVQDQWGPVGGGDFSFVHGQTQAQLRVRPCHGDAKVSGIAQSILKGQATKPFAQLVLCYDGDKGGSDPSYLHNIYKSVTGTIASSGPLTSLGDGRWRLKSGAQAAALVWHQPGPTQDGVPAQQCLERLVCAAAAEVWPDRLASVGSWLQARPSPTTSHTTGSGPGTIAKSHSWALMGGWFAEHGCDDFFKEVWNPGPLANQLKARLESTGAWNLLKSCQAP